MDKYDEEMLQGVADLIVQMLLVREQYRQMCKDMSQTVKALQENDRELAGQKGQVFFDVADKIREDGEDVDDFLKVTNVGLTAQVVAIKKFLEELDEMFAKIPMLAE